jgi:hypothetical protein
MAVFGPMAIAKAKLKMSYRLRGNSSDFYIAWEHPAIGNASGDRTVALRRIGCRPFRVSPDR